MNSEFWKDRRVFITGHTGFKGSWLSLWLQKLGAKVTGFALTPATRPNLYCEANIEEGMDSIIGDIRDIEFLKKSLAAANPEIVIHMAAQSLVRRSYKDPIDTYAINIIGTVNLYEAIRVTPAVKAIICVTSDKCYENNGSQISYCEADPLGGYDPYSSSKACVEILSSSYRNSFFNCAASKQDGVALATARAGNVIGGGDWAEDRLIPDIIRAFEQKRELIIRNPTALRPWQHVLEPLHGYLLLAEKLFLAGFAYAEAWNFGPLDDDIQPVESLVKQISKRFSTTGNWKLSRDDNPYEAHAIRLNAHKANEKLGWKPKLNLEQALDLTVEWTKARNNNCNMRDVTFIQIHHYETIL